MAVAHVGVELLLDGVLAADDDAVADFEHIVSGAAIEGWLDDGQARYEAMAKRLLAIEVPRVYADPDRVSDALYRMLARRPRLALAAEDRASVCTWLRAVQPRVADARIALADGLVPAVRERFTGA